MFGKGRTRKASSQRISHILWTYFNNSTWPSSRTSSRKNCTRVSTCLVRSRLAGFSLIMIQEALSSHISVAPTVGTHISFFALSDNSDPITGLFIDAS